MKLVVQSVQYLQYLQSSGVQCCRAASRCLPRCLRRPWGLIINQLHCHQHHHHNQNHHQKHHDHDQVGGVMDEGTIGRNASAMRENVSHILTKVIISIIFLSSPSSSSASSSLFHHLLHPHYDHLSQKRASDSNLKLECLLHPPLYQAQ